jgi:hypothetical protein
VNVDEETAARAETPDELRREIVAGIDAALSRPIIARFISTHDARIMRAQRDYWQTVDEAQLAKLLDLVNRQP